MRNVVFGMLLTSVPGLAYSYSAFNQPLSVGYGWSALSVASVIGLALFLNGVGSLLAGPAVDRRGPRYIALIGVSLIGIGNLLVAYAVPVFGFPAYLIGFGCVIGLGNGFVYIAGISTVMKAGGERYGFAGALSALGFGLGSLVYSTAIRLTPSYQVVAHAASSRAHALAGAVAAGRPLVGAAAVLTPADLHNLTTLFAVSGIAITAYGFIVAAFTGGPAPAPAERRAEDVSLSAAVRTQQAWMIWLTFFLAAIAGGSIFGNALPILTELTRRPSSQLASFLTLFALAGCLGRIGLGTIADVVGFRKTLTVAFVALAGVFFAVAAIRTSTAAIVGFALAYLLYGGVAGLLTGWTARSFGTGHIGAIWGFANTGYGTACLLGPWFVSMYHEVGGSYANALVPIGVLVAGAAVMPVMMIEGARTRRRPHVASGSIPPGGPPPPVPERDRRAQASARQ